jgi:hypothetical protein
VSLVFLINGSEHLFHSDQMQKSRLHSHKKISTGGKTCEIVCVLCEALSVQRGCGVVADKPPKHTELSAEQLLQHRHNILSDTVTSLETDRLRGAAAYMTLLPPLLPNVPKQNQ